MTWSNKENPMLKWLRQFAQRLAVRMWRRSSRDLLRPWGRDGMPNIYLHVNTLEPSMQKSLEFLAIVLQLIVDNRKDIQQIYPYLKANQQRLNDTLLEAISIAAPSWFNGDKNQQKLVAAMFGGFGNLIAQFPLGNREINLELAITAYQQALQVFTREAFPKQWAAMQNDLANAYSQRIRGERAENLEQALAAFQLVLQVDTREAFPVDWAMTQHNLANAYRDRIRRASGRRTWNRPSPPAGWRCRSILG
ncbi:tetratricopeptide repeat protein, partial [Candidatus Competibacter phosphatis]|nr:tetratricopeptide repeat protein [Candidatus Competibacter phosphatis]